MQNLEIKHLDQASISQTELTIDALARIAPSCITEVKDSKTGSIKHAVDFRVLRQLLGDNAVEDSAEAYQFTWVGKQEARREAAKSINKTLRPVPEDSVDWDNTQNIYIEGDNLEALKLLQKSYLGKVKMIYIDPPYNTGNDFVYHDDFKQSQSDYDEVAGNVDEEGNRLVSRGKGGSLDDAFKKNTDSNGRFHSDWCSMIYSRLMIARSLLTEDGVIFIHMDEHENCSLQKICEEVFGENNDLGTIIWDKRNPKGSVAGVAYQHESIIVFSKNKTIFSERCKFLKDKENAEHMISFVNSLIKRNKGVNEEVRNSFKNWIKEHKKELSGGELAYSLIDNHGNIYQPVSMAAPDKPETRSHRPLIHPITQKPCPVPAKGWRFTDQKMDELIKADKIEFGKDENTQPRQKYFLKENLKEAVSSVIYYGGSDNAMGLPFDNPKPVYIVKRLISSLLQEKDIVIDFFSGSATTAHAVMQLNAEDGGNRRFIMVQLPEETAENSEAYKAGYKNICEIGKERIRRAGTKIKDELEKKQAENANKEKGLFDGNDDGESRGAKLDTGFRVFRIDSGNMKDVEQSPSDIKQTELDWFLDNVKDDRTELDLLFGCMLNWGVQLSLPMSMETVDGCNIYTVNEGDLVACLTKDQPVTENIVRAIAEKSPLRVLFRDGSFASDAAKINIFEQFKQLMDWSDDEIIKNVRVL